MYAVLGSRLNDVREVLSPFALQLGFAIAAVIAALVAGFLMLRQGSRRSDRGETESGDYVRHSDLKRTLQSVRREFDNSIEAAQAAAERAAKRSESVVSAVKPIELALPELRGRIAQFKGRDGARASAGLKPWPGREDQSAGAGAAVIEDEDVTPEGREQRLRDATDLLFLTLNQVIEGAKREGESTAVRAIEARLAHRTFKGNWINQFDVWTSARPSGRTYGCKWMK